MVDNWGGGGVAYICIYMYTETLAFEAKYPRALITYIHECMLACIHTYIHA